jgi:hypothetical protein
MSFLKYCFYYSFFLVPWDLTDSLQANATEATPRPRTGRIRAEVQFSNPIPENIHLLVFVEKDCVMSVTGPILSVSVNTDAVQI